MSSLLQDLHPIFQPVARAILEDCAALLMDKHPGSTIKPAVTFRSMSDQAAAKAAGLSQVNLGWHQMGLALDVAILGPQGQYVTDGEDERYALFGRAALQHDCIWGGHWTHPDWDHAEFHPGFTLAQYLAWLDEHKVATA